MNNSLLEIGAKLAIIYVPFLFALCFHEWAHGMVAKLRGDRTAEMMGRLTLNPLAHMDLLGTLVLPIISIVSGLSIFFGWAKPVPVNERNLKNPRTDMFWVALAGPLSNIFLAAVGAALIALIYFKFMQVEVLRDSIQLLKSFIVTNMFLAIFNLIPLHPLDGGKVLARFLPESLNRKLEDNEQMTSLVLLFLVLSGVLKVLAVPVYYTSQMMINIALGGFF